MSQVAPAERSLIDDDLGHVVAQLDRQIEAGVDSHFGAEVEGGTADFPTLGVNRPHRAGRRSASRPSA